MVVEGAGEIEAGPVEDVASLSSSGRSISRKRICWSRSSSRVPVLPVAVARPAGGSKQPTRIVVVERAHGDAGEFGSWFWNGA